MNKKEIAAALDRAVLEAKPRGRITAEYPAFSVADGYEVQDLLLGLQQARGDRLVGRKLGMTSKAKMQQMNLSAPIHGFLTNAMTVANGGSIELKGRIHPKAEPEIAFLTKRELQGPVSAAEALAALEGISLALEIIDSRFINYDFALPDVLADNCSSSGYVLASEICKYDPAVHNNLGIVLEVDGKPAQFGSSAAIMGDPLRAFLDLIHVLDKQGKSLAAGSVVLAGAATAAVPLAKGQWVRARGEGLGSAEFFVC